MSDRFVLQAIDPLTGCIAHDLVFDVEDLNELCERMAMSLKDFNPKLEYTLDRSEADRIKEHFRLAFEPAGCDVSVRAWRPIDSLPYKVHTNRELAMMLAGTKPLAAFVGEFPANSRYEEIPERFFDPYVRSGRFVKRECIYPTSCDGQAEPRKFRRVLYALPHEQWRIDAYLLLHETAEKSGWSEGFERMEGTLLGYEDWQNDAYLEMSRQRMKAPSPEDEVTPPNIAAQE